MTSTPVPPVACRVCAAEVQEFLDLGTGHPISQHFPRPQDTPTPQTYRLAVGFCVECTMVQLIDDVPREHLFTTDYPFTSSDSVVVSDYFRDLAGQLLDTELRGPSPFMIEIGCNDGTLLAPIAAAGVRHVGFEPSANVAEKARRAGVTVRPAFFDSAVVDELLESEGPATVLFSSYVISGITELGSLFTTVAALLAADGVFIFEDAYLGDVVQDRAFDQIYDEHVYLFSAHSVQAAAERHALELVDAQRISVRGGGMRYTLAHPGRRLPTRAVRELLNEETDRALNDPTTLMRFADDVRQIKHDLVATLERLRAEGRKVVGYGATAKGATVLQYCDIGPDLIEYVVDSTPAKQGHVTPAKQLPIRPPSAFAADPPDYAVLFAWFHATEIITREKDFAARGGRWLVYVPEVHVR